MSQTILLPKGSNIVCEISAIFFHIADHFYPKKSRRNFVLANLASLGSRVHENIVDPSPPRI